MDDPDLGNGSLVNAVTPGPGGTCAAVGACTTTTPVTGSFTVHKTSDPASGQSVGPGGVIHYTLTVTGVGAPVTGASVRDDLSAVLDDAAYNGDAQTTSGALSYASPGLSWTGDLSAGQVVTVTYSVTVNDPDRGDAVVTNAVTPGVGGTCDQSCSTQHGVPGGFSVTKQVDPASGTEVAVGQRLTYTVTVTGGNAPTSNASFTDDLSDVLDDAVVSPAVADAGTTVRNGDLLTWTIPTLSAGQVVTITYTATVDDPDGGNGNLANLVKPGPGGVCGAACTVVNPVRGTFTVTKKASATGPVHPGDTVTYTVTVTAGPAPAAGAGFVDTLADVLDDATLTGAPSATGGSVAYDAVHQDISWTDDLAANETITVTYSVVVNDPDRGDGVLVNHVTPNGDGSCPSDADCATNTPVRGDFTVTKTANHPSGSTVHAGDRVTYTITVTGGDAPVVDAAVTDDLSSVLVGATYDGDLQTDAGSAAYQNGAISWSISTLTAGQVVSVVYSVTIKAVSATTRLTNTAIPSADGHCAGDGQCTVIVDINPDPASPGPTQPPAAPVRSGPPSGLAYTGAPLTGYFGLAALILIAGLGLTVAGRRRSGRA